MEMERICPDFARMTVDWAFGGVMSQPGLDLRTRQLVLIASCVTLGYAMPQLRAHTEAALEAGASETEVVEMILQLLFYAGGPAVRNALVLADEVFTARARGQSPAPRGDSHERRWCSPACLVARTAPFAHELGASTELSQ